MAEKRQFPTPEMLEAREKLAKLTPEEKQARENIMREELRRYYAGRPSREMQRLMLEEDE